MSEPINDIKNETNTNLDLLNNSIDYLKDYRKLQARRLKIRLDIFTKVVIDKFGSIDKVKCNGCEAIESQRDIDIINKIIELESFITIPVYTSDAKAITHFYTIGLWYYWGIPEIVLEFNLPITDNTEFANVILNIIHDKLFSMHREKIIINNTGRYVDINRIDFSEEPKKIKLMLDKFDVNFKMIRIDGNQYMDIRAYFMMWFYMYYMNATKNEKDEPQLYPVYKINIDRNEYTQVSKKIMDKLLFSTIEKLRNDKVASDEKNELSTIEEESDSDESVCGTENLDD